MSRREPSRAVEWLLRRVLPNTVAEPVLGDLLEELRQSGNRARYLRQALSIAVYYTPGRLRRAPRHLPGASDGTERKPMGLESVVQDLKYAVRGLAKRPGFAVVVVLTLGLGIGASTAIFSIVDGILLQPLPFADPDRLVMANETKDGQRMTIAWPNYVDLRDRASSFESIACHQPNAFTLLGDGKPRRVNGRLVCAGFFEVLGIQPQTGRTFRAEDDRVGATPVAIVSDRFWKQDLGADPAVLGRTIRMSEKTFTIIGVLPAGFRFSRPEDFYAPVGLTITKDSGWLDRGNHFGLFAIARLKPGVELSQADAEVKRVADDLARAYPNTNAGNGGEVELLRDRFVDQVKSTLVALMGAVAFLLLLACVNVANLLVARGAARQHELAIRTALGGSRWRLVRQLLSESTLLSLAGGVLGILLAAWLVQTLVVLAPEGTPRIENVRMNWTSLTFALTAAIACGLIFGTFPALHASGIRGQHLLARASRTSAAISPRRTRRGLMIVEVALALILLAGCGLMARTMLRLSNVDTGFRADHLLTGRVMLAGDAWNNEARRLAFYDDVLARAKAVPGVRDAALTLSLPIDGSNWGSIFTVRDKPVPPRAELPSAAFIPVSPGYFSTMEMRLLKGRAFDDRDSPQGARVIIVNQKLAGQLWPGEDAIGKQLKQGWPETPEADAPWRTVVGQTPVRSIAIVARTEMEPTRAAAPLEAAVLASDKDLPLTRVLPMTQLMRDAVARQRVSTVILALFSAVAILLAAVGLYGVVSHSVTERTREIGVRMALGAERGQVLRLFVRNGLATAAAGTVIGLAGALALSRSLESLLFEVKPSDPLTFVAVAVLLLAVAMVACYLPARRAAGIDPLLALRTE
ncbi:MAG: ABC transporter permease [Acidobacteria bacterium]|nr:ABC transporter permease [Acidobacteriota bacterium]